MTMMPPLHSRIGTRLTLWLQPSRQSSFFESSVQMATFRFALQGDKGFVLIVFYELILLENKTYRRFSDSWLLLVWSGKLYVAFD